MRSSTRAAKRNKEVDMEEKKGTRAGSGARTSEGLIEVKLTAAHTHQGQPYKSGDTIRVRPGQLHKLREWGVIK